MQYAKNCDAYKIVISNPNISEQEKHNQVTTCKLQLSKPEKCSEVLKDDKKSIYTDYELFSVLQ